MQWLPFNDICVLSSHSSESPEASVCLWGHSAKLNCVVQCDSFKVSPCFSFTLISPVVRKLRFPLGECHLQVKNTILSEATLVSLKRKSTEINRNIGNYKL